MSENANNKLMNDIIKKKIEEREIKKNTVYG